MTTASRRIAAAVLTLGLFSVGAPALEISLEENKAERGNIGYVDLQKVFKLYPETHKAKQSYSQIVRQAQEQLELKKSELFALRAELSKAKLERDLFAQTPLPAPPPAAEPAAISTRTPAPGAPQAAAAPVEAPGISTGTPNAAVEVSSAPSTEVAASTRTGARAQREIPAELRGLPGMSTPLSENDSEPESTDPEALVINIPGVTDEPIVVAPPAAQTQNRAAEIAAKAEQARARPATAPAAAGAVAAETTAKRLDYENAKRVREERLRELEEKAAALEAKTAAAETAFDAYRKQLEDNLLDIESRRSEILLGKIYKAVREVAREAGVSVVVDKSQILYGQGSVDLTETVIKRLEASPK